MFLWYLPDPGHSSCQDDGVTGLSHIAVPLSALRILSPLDDTLTVMVAYFIVKVVLVISVTEPELAPIASTVSVLKLKLEKNFNTHPQMPDWHVVFPQKSGPVPPLPSMLQQLSMCWRIAGHQCWIPYVPSVLYTLSPYQSPS